MQARTSISSAILDLDGTLVDTIGDFTHALNAMLGDLGLAHVTSLDVEPLVGRGSEHLIASILELRGANLKSDDLAWGAYQRHYRSINGQFARVYPGVDEGLDALRAMGLRLACLTNKPTDFARQLLERMRLASHFDFVFGGDAFERKKPDAIPVLKTCESLGSLPAHTLVVGDSVNDAAAARAAGCPVVLVTYGYNHGKPVRGVDADWFLDSIGQVPGWLRG